jgi:glycosyltransferase involved in cell wall biosynthesis
MLCECVPVVTRKGALPEVVGDSGFYVEYGNVEETTKAIGEALGSELRKKARSRIETNFPLKRREERIREIIDNLRG